jgi:Ser/Thr protein kinase RdoA (MazF antagonist)
MEGVGHWLARFQGFHAGDRRLSGREITEYVDVRLRLLVERGVMAPDTRERLLAHLEGLAARVAPDDWHEVAVHADLAPANILVAPGRIVLLDFAMASRGTKLHDISRLYMQTELLRAKPQFRRAVIATLQTALLRGFDPALSPEDPLFRLLSVLHHVNHLGTLALRREPIAARLVSMRAIGMHRRWIRRALERGAQ